VVTAPDSITSQLVAVLLRGAVFAVGFLVLRIGYRWLRRREGIGLGDVKLAGAGGVWIGWMMIPVVIEIAAATALTFYLACYLRRRGDDHGHSVHLGDRLPFGLFLAPAIWIGWLIDSSLAPTSFY
jgi:leader peptidase (prepilin peptidase) / N-methyltransferase